MAHKTVVLPSSRSIRDTILKSTHDTFLDNFLTMGEFLSRCITIKELSFVDEDTRNVLLLEASNFHSFEKLRIERNFFTFTKNSSYIFGFFEELSSELVALETLEDADLYGEYEEHLKILSLLQERYEKLCLEYAFVDKIFLPKHYALNEAYIKTLTEIELYIEGMLTNFELEVLQKISRCTTLKLHFQATRFNVKMRRRLEAMGFVLEVGKRYELLLDERRILKQESFDPEINVELIPVSQRILQVAVVKKKIDEFIQSGVEPQKIAVVLPTENFKEYLELFDSKNNFNFAMGSDFTNTNIYQKIDATIKALDEFSVENEANLDRVGDELYVQWHGIYAKKVSEINLNALLESLLDFTQSKEERKILQEEIFKYEKFHKYLQNLSFKAALNIFLSRVKKRTLDDVGGGKITVLGLLETRGVEFEAVVIVDFNDMYVPKRIEKDMFINSVLRERVGLPSTQDREALQKHYYYSILQKAKKSVLCYVDNNTELPSRFIKELGLKKKTYLDEESLSLILLQPGKMRKIKEETIVFEYDFTNTLISNTLLCTYLTCKRKFFYRYVKRIRDFSIPTDIPQEWEIGAKLHLALKQLYAKAKSFVDEKKLYEALTKELDDVQGPSELERFQIKLYKEALKKFVQTEISRFKEGFRVRDVEANLTLELGKLTLGGTIDRIDEKEGELFVLDYKSGSIKLYNEKNVEEANDFQLEFYHLLASKEKRVAEVAFYDLKNAKVIPEHLFERKMELLLEHLKALEEVKEIEAVQCEDISVCNYCEYKIMCGRA